VAAAVADEQLCAGQTVAANHTLGRSYRPNGLEAFGADGNPGDVIQGSTAESAISGEKHRKAATQDGLQGRDEDGTLLGALLSSF
jgi:hypothetical protein